MTTITVEVPQSIAKHVGSIVSLDCLIEYMFDEAKYWLFFDEIEESNLSLQTQNMIMKSEKEHLKFISVKDR